MRSMTGFASVEGAVQLASGATARWRWDARSVNGKGFDMRMRTPPGWDRFEPAWRNAAAAALRRGTATCALTIEAETPRGDIRLNSAALASALGAASAARAAAEAAGVSLAPASLDGLLALRGVLETADAGADASPEDPALANAVGTGFQAAVAALAEARGEEGAALKRILTERTDEIARLVADAESKAGDRLSRITAKMSEKLGDLSALSPEIDESRLAQELALLAVKADVREELDRLGAHINAARALFAQDEPVGRKLDFLTQEFNREANTLCAKSQDAALTEVGLALKVAIDHLREQAANVE